MSGTSRLLWHYLGIQLKREKIHLFHGGYSTGELTNGFPQGRIFFPCQTVQNGLLNLGKFNDIIDSETQTEVKGK